MKIVQLTVSAVVATMLSPLLANAASVVIQPAPYPVGMDVWFGSKYYTTAQRDGKLLIGGWGDEYDTLLRFNMSGLPQAATQALLYLYAFPRTDGSTLTATKWYRVTTPWQANSVSWSTPMYGVFLATLNAPPSSGWYVVDFTSIYNAWRTGSSVYPNLGFRLLPASTNNQFDSFYASSNSNAGVRPALVVYYTPQSNDSIPKFKWSLSTSYSARYVTQPFGIDWAGGSRCPYPNGPLKKHNGTDFRASAETAVYAAEDGMVKEIASQYGWASNIVIEHTNPSGGKQTTVYWHVNPISSVAAIGAFVPKGTQIATVADLTPYGNATHFHIGTRVGTYTANLSGTGALPTTTCTDPNGITYLAFPAGFVDPNNTANVIFQ